jgi:hypothetical protein
VALGLLISPGRGLVFIVIGRYTTSFGVYQGNPSRQLELKEMLYFSSQISTPGIT